MARIAIQTLTRDIAYAAATDAGNRSMWAGGRRKWNVDDYNTAVDEFERLWPEAREMAREWEKDHVNANK